MNDRPNARVTDLEPLSLSPKEAGRLLGVSRDYITNLVKRGTIRGSRCGSRILIDYRALVDFYENLPEAYR
jgi:excisionase family DNA binding protein